MSKGNVMRGEARALVIAVLGLLAHGVANAAAPSPQEVAAFWGTVFEGPAPYGVPPLNATRFNQRILDNCTVWDVRFDSYKDPVTDAPVRLGGVFAVPNSVVPPGPGGTFPGLVVTHSVGIMPPSGPAPDDVQGMATWFAQKGFATLAFYMRGWGTSSMSVTSDLFTDFLAQEDGQPLDNRWTGMAVDAYQSGEFLAAQPEVWDPDGLTYVGHSGGGYAVLAGGVFSRRFKVLSASAPAGAWPDSGAWLDFVWGNGGFLSIQTWVNGQPDPVVARDLVERTLDFISMNPVIDNTFMLARNAEWSLDRTALFLYGGQADTAIPAWDVATNFALADPSASDLKAMHWSPIGGHGGPESWNRAQAWVAGHFPGAAATRPIAALTVTSIVGATVDLSSSGSQAWEYDWSYASGSMTANDDNIVSWDYDFGDGTTRNWGPTVSHTYADPGSYVVTVTITDGAGLRSSVSVPVSVLVGSGSNPQLQVVADVPEVVSEGGVGSFLIRLTEQPAGNVIVSVARTAGDVDLDVVGGASLAFTPGNWDAFQVITLTAASDADRASSMALFSVSAPGLTTVDVNAQERDDEAGYTLVVGDAAAAPGATAAVPITLLNPDAAPVASLSISLSFDATVLTNPRADGGPDLPGPAWWNLVADVPAAGLEEITGSEFVQPANPVIDGVIIVGTFDVAASAPSGTYPITIVSASVNGIDSAGVDGSITVTSAARAGEIPPTMTVTRAGADLRITWSASCSGGATDYAIYGGALGAWYSHAPLACSDAGTLLEETLTPTPGNAYYLVVPHRIDEEGSHGRDSSGRPRPAGPSPCVAPQVFVPCAP